MMNSSAHQCNVHRQKTGSLCVVHSLLFPRLDLTLTIQFHLDGVAEATIQTIWSNEIFARNLPEFNVQSGASRARPHLSLFLRKGHSGQLHLRLMQHRDILTYTLKDSELAEDLLKFVLQASAAKAARRGLVFIHASALITTRGAVLVPGPSGTGKSTIALSWIAEGRPVAASETSVVDRRGLLYSGNTLLSIKRQTADRFLGAHSLTPDGTAGDYLLFPQPDLAHILPLPIVAVLFIKLTEEGCKTRDVSVSPRRASMKLYEAAHWLVAGGFLIGGQLRPYSPRLNYNMLRQVATVATVLSAKPLHWIEGGSIEIVQWIASSF